MAITITLTDGVYTVTFPVARLRLNKQVPLMMYSLAENSEENAIQLDTAGAVAYIEMEWEENFDEFLAETGVAYKIWKNLMTPDVQKVMTLTISDGANSVDYMGRIADFIIEGYTATEKRIKCALTYRVGGGLQA